MFIWMRSVVWSGYIAGTKYDYPGSGANMLCVHGKITPPETNVPGTDTISAVLFGAEFQIAGTYSGDKKPFSQASVGGKTLHCQDPLCAVCYVPNSSTNIMIPGRQDCGDAQDWTLQYKGLLVAQWAGGSRTSNEYICVDGARGLRGEGGGERRSLGGQNSTRCRRSCRSLPCTGVSRTETKWAALSAPSRLWLRQSSDPSRLWLVSRLIHLGSDWSSRLIHLGSELVSPCWS